MHSSSQRRIGEHKNDKYTFSQSVKLSHVKTIRIYAKISLK